MSVLAERLIAEGLLLDGKRALPYRVGLSLDPGALVLSAPGAERLCWPLDRLRRMPDQADRRRAIFASADDAVARLIVDDAGMIGLLERRALHLNRRQPVVRRGRLLGWAAAAVASVTLIIFVLVPVMADQLASYMPPEGEKALGDATLEQVRRALSASDYAPLRLCDRPRGVAALQAMYGRLADGMDLPYPATLHVLDADVVNAFALPGGHVVFFRGLIDLADRPEEVAAVFAHELGHVAHRDPTRSALRSAGSIGVLGLLLGDFAGGTVVLFLTERLIDATYSRAAEAAADAFAYAALIHADVRPDALATLFERLKGKYGDSAGLLKHFEAHPALGNRIEAAREASEAFQGDGTPILSPSDWQALKVICG